jgi:hypothetical protein
MQGKKLNLDRISVPTRIIVHRSELSTAALAEAIQKGEFAPETGATCELEAGGEIIARGKIVRRRGEFHFRVLETAKEAKS